jgi:ATP-dependent DNA helicase RecQ
MVHPVTLEGFGEVNGISEYKKNRYGKDFIEVIKRYY